MHAEDILILLQDRTDALIQEVFHLLGSPSDEILRTQSVFQLRFVHFEASGPSGIFEINLLSAIIVLNDDLFY